jgi:hypothetical protein
MKVESLSRTAFGFKGASNAESCIRKAAAARGFSPGLVGLADTKAEDEAASRWADCASPMGIEWPDPIPPDAPGGPFGLTQEPPRGLAMPAAGAQAEGVPAPPVEGGRSRTGV